VHTIVHKKGVISDSFEEFFTEGGDYVGQNYLRRITPVTSDRAYQLLACFAAFQALLLMFMPGKTFHGPITAAGNRPVYKVRGGPGACVGAYCSPARAQANGVQCVVATAVAYASLYAYGLLDPVEIYTLFPEMIAGMSRVSLLFCTLLLVKGHLAPSSSDSGSGGSIVGDFYWGMELYPRFFGGRLDVKTFTNCRFGMMGWGVLCVTFALANAERHGGMADSMAVCTVLMLVYIFKFFVWETGYWGSMDIMHDRAGYMICWGCLVFVPSIYTSPALYLVDHAPTLGLPAAAAMLVAGLAAIYINYDADVQRQVVRAANGNAKVWGAPARVIRAQYVTAGGERKTSLLLASGWWGVARHFHYVPEITAAFLWSLPCGFNAFLPYFYVCFLTILLADRALRDDTRCRSKYGAAWAEYCKRVPYKMLPYVY
jgi:7-dehydrocholesterol reductase